MTIEFRKLGLDRECAPEQTPKFGTRLHEGKKENETSTVNA
jgi:hypothetical protein